MKELLSHFQSTVQGAILALFCVLVLRPAPQPAPTVKQPAPREEVAPMPKVERPPLSRRRQETYEF